MDFEVIALGTNSTEPRPAPWEKLRKRRAKRKGDSGAPSKSFSSVAMLEQGKFREHQATAVDAYDPYGPPKPTPACCHRRGSKCLWNRSYADPITFVRLLDTDTAIPGQTDTFSSFEAVSLRGGTLVFRGLGPHDGGGQEIEGVFAYASGDLQVIADRRFLEAQEPSRSLAYRQTTVTPRSSMVAGPGSQGFTTALTVSSM